MTSSLLVATLDETLAKAKVMAKELGIVRVTDTTWLDGIGIPVFASIRPDSLTLCVNAGKGVHRDEAKVVAYMEAIEFALAEPRNNRVEIVMATPAQCGASRPLTADSIISRLKNRWYAERSLFLLRQLLTDAGCETFDIDEQLTAFDRFRLKRIDLVTSLKERPWRSG